MEEQKSDGEDGEGEGKRRREQDRTIREVQADPGQKRGASVRAVRTPEERERQAGRAAAGEWLWALSEEQCGTNAGTGSPLPNSKLRTGDRR
jgi:hypothetical protein